MSKELSISTNLGSLPKVFQGQKFDDELSSGVSGGFGVISFRGKVWRIKFAGEEKNVLRNDGSGDPASSLEVVLVKASHTISKNYYAGGYVEGTNDQPTCWSTNGVAPDAQVVEKQNPTCGNCRHNVFGSRVTEAGKKAKACSDNKRIAVVPLGDIPNESFGGPMLLRVPAASLVDMAQYGKRMGQAGYPTFAIGTRLGFDPNEAYPKLTFREIRALTDDEASLVMELRSDPQTERILAEAVEASSEASPQVANVNFEQPAPREEEKPSTHTHTHPPKATPKATPNKSEPKAEARPEPKVEAKKSAVFGSPGDDQGEDEGEAEGNGGFAPVPDDLDAQLEALLPSVN